MEMTVGSGKGYAPADMNKPDEPSTWFNSDRFII